MKKRKVLVGDRDLRIFNYLYENKVAVRQQICRDNDWLISPQAFYRRINKLVGAGLIDLVPHISQRKGRAYSLGKLGFREYISEGAELRNEYRSRSVAHDLDLVDIRAMLLDSPNVVSYHTENVLKGGGRTLLGDDFVRMLERMPDAIAMLKYPTAEFHVTIEYERSLKYADRYRDLFNYFYSKDIIPGVLYVCGDKKIKQHLMAIESRVVEVDRRKIFYTDLPTMLRSDKYEFVSVDQRMLTLQAGSKRITNPVVSRLPSASGAGKSRKKLSKGKYNETALSRPVKILQDYIASHPEFLTSRGSDSIVDDLTGFVSVLADAIRSPESSQNSESKCSEKLKNSPEFELIRAAFEKVENSDRSAMKDEVKQVS